MSPRVTASLATGSDHSICILRNPGRRRSHLRLQPRHRREGLAVRERRAENEHLARKQRDFFSEKRPSARANRMFSTFSTHTPLPIQRVKRE